jgi:ComF family protein
VQLLDVIFAKIAPYDCLSCGEEGSLLCANCTPKLGIKTTSKCFRCERITHYFLVCNECKTRTSLRSVVSHYPYAGLAKQLVHEFKFNGKRAAAKEIAALMTVSLPAEAILVHIPTATTRVRERGYDHARLLARALSERSGLVHRTHLGRMHQTRQLGTGRADRLAHIEGAFRIIGDVRNAHIILVDDVVTTGATLSEAAKVLRRAGAKCVDAIVFAATER